MEVDLLAVFLITRSRPGPKLVFHYPPRPKVPGTSEQQDVDLDSEDSGEDEPLDNGLNPERDSREQPLWSNGASSRDLANLAPDEPREPIASSESILGHSVETLETLLSPGRWSDGEKFQIEVDGVTFIGHPIFAALDGTWPATEHAETPQQSSQESKTVDNHHQRDIVPIVPHVDQPIHRMAQISTVLSGTPRKAAYRDFTHIPESLDSQCGASLATSMNSASTASGMLMEQMTMFNVVLACGSRAQSQLKILHQNILVQFTKALHYCQQHSNYVGAESRKLSALRMKAKQDRLGTEAESTQLLERSEFAWAIMEIYEKTRVGKVANFKVDGMEMSLQMPVDCSRNALQATTLSPHAGLLLLESKEVLLRDLKLPEASSLAYFIREHTPTKSLQKHATNLQLHIQEVLFLAEHLVTWRKARATAPLHQRNYYVAAPDAPLDQASQRAPGLLRRFPALPSLPNMLQMLSGRPIKYGLLIPSRDHRQTYMDLLAYLLRHGFVVQLKTSGWLKMPEDFRQLRLHHEHADSARTTSATNLLLPHMRSLEDDAASVSSERTAIPFSAAMGMKNRSRQPSDGSRPAGDAKDDTDDIVVIRSLTEPSPDEAQALDYIRSTIVDVELREHFPSLLRYFDGEHVFEEIAAHKGMKRAKLEAWLETLTQAGHLMTFRYL